MAEPRKKKEKKKDIGRSEKSEKMTWSPLEGGSPEPRRRSKALTPPEFGSSEKSDMAAEYEEGACIDSSEQQHAAEMNERDKAFLLVVDEDANGVEDEEEGVAGMVSDEDDLRGTK